MDQSGDLVQKVGCLESRDIHGSMDLPIPYISSERLIVYPGEHISISACTAPMRCLYILYISAGKRVPFTAHLSTTPIRADVRVCAPLVRVRTNACTASMDAVHTGCRYRVGVHTMYASDTLYSITHSMNGMCALVLLRVPVALAKVRRYRVHHVCTHSEAMLRTCIRRRYRYPYVYTLCSAYALVCRPLHPCV